MTTGSPAPARRPRPRTALLGALVVALLVAALAVWAVNRSDDPAQDAAAGPGGTSSTPTGSATPTEPAAPATPAVPDTSATPDPAQPPTASAPGGSPAPGTDAATDPATDPGGTQPLPAESGEFGEVAAAPVDEPVAVSGGVTLAVGGLEAVDGEALGPGEVAGPAVRFTVQVTNTTGAEVSLASAAVNAYFGASASPGLQLSGSGASPLPVTVAAGQTVSGVYVFLLPDDRTPTRIEVFSVPEAEVLLVEAPTP